MIANNVRLEEVPFLNSLPDEVRENLRPYADQIYLDRVEVLPDERRWILHFPYRDPWKIKSWAAWRKPLNEWSIQR